MRSVLATAELGYGPPSLEKSLGSLPVIRDLLARLDLVAVIDRLCPIQENKARHTHGEVIAMLVANRLTSPTPLVRVIDAAGATFVAPAPRTIVGLAALAAHDPATATIVDWAPQREKDKLFHQRDVHRVVEGSTTLRGPKATDPPFTTRTVHSHSARRATASAASRQKQIDKARAALVVLHRDLGTHYYPDEAAVRARVEKIIAECRVGAWLRTHVDTGKPLLTWYFDEAALDLAAKADGWFALLTNQSIQEKDAAGVFVDYKGQEAAERRNSAVKGPSRSTRSTWRTTSGSTDSCTSSAWRCCCSR